MLVKLYRRWIDISGLQHCNSAKIVPEPMTGFKLHYRNFIKLNDRHDLD